MADSAFVYPTETRPARHFWRRAGAFVIDLLLFYLVLGIIGIPIQILTGWNMGITIGTVTSCDVAKPSALTQQVEAEWPLAAGDIRSNQICTISGLFIPTQRYFITAVTTTENGATATRTASTFIDENEKAIPASLGSSLGQTLFQVATMALLIFASAKFTAARGRTPGKTIMSTRVIDRTATTPSLTICLVRETMKYLPVFVSLATTPFIATSVQSGLPLPQSGEFTDVIRAARSIDFSKFGSFGTIGLIGTILLFIWWFGPFIIWRGQSFYDRIAGCFVVRSGAASPATPT